MSFIENSYCYDDILINPCISTVKSRKDIDLSVNIDSIKMMEICNKLKALYINSSIEEYLKKQLKDAKSVIIKTEKMDSSEKYGRILGWVYLDGDSESINNKLINDGYAWGYLGETKIKDFDALKKAREKSGK